MSLSIIIPAFNEASRIGLPLERIKDYSRRFVPELELELIVIDDGSTDGTTEVVRAIAADWPCARVLQLTPNGGKGAAVRAGCLSAKGDFILIYDADGATPIEEEARFRALLADDPNCDIVVGVRYEDMSVIRMSSLRRNLGWLFSVLSSFVIGRKCRDSQCGFKMLRRCSVVPLIKKCREGGYAFDVELLAYMHRSGQTIKECNIRWTSIDGSKVSVCRDGAVMLVRLVVIWLRVIRFCGFTIPRDSEIGTEAISHSGNIAEYKTMVPPNV